MTLKRAVLLALLYHVLTHVTEGKMQDLTYQMKPGNAMSRFPTHEPFVLKVLAAGPYNADIPWVAMNELTATEHTGTHIDAPYHFAEHGRFVHDIPLEDLYGAAVVIDIRERADNDSQAVVSAQDLQDWETAYGPIPHGAYVLMHSGWQQYWGDQERFVGPTMGNLTETLMSMAFPGFSEESVDWLLENRPTVKGIGVDTVSCDSGENLAFPAHQTWLGRDKICIEMLANLDRIPEDGSAELHVLPLLIHNGTGAPSRIYAAWNTEGTTSTTTWKTPVCAAPHSVSSGYLAFLLMVIVSYLMYG